MPHIRKYENRRLYDTGASKYVNLEEIAEMVRRGEEVTVEDSKTGRDLTQEVLLQVVLTSPAGAALVPVGLLRRIIRAAANPVLSRGIDPALAQGLDLFHRQLEALERGMPAFPGWPARDVNPAGPWPATSWPATPPQGPNASPPPPSTSPQGAKAPQPAAGGAPDGADYHHVRPGADLHEPPPPPPPPYDPGPGPGDAADPELDALRARLDALEKRLRRG